MSRQLTRHDDLARIDAAYLYAASGNYSKVARDTGINRKTIMSWAKDNVVWAEALVKARQEISDEVLAQNLAIATAANDGVLDRLEHGDTVLRADGSTVKVPLKGRDMAVIGGIMQDKARVQMGMATSITGSEDTRALAEVCMELSRTMRDHKVVSTISHNGDKTGPE
ncbi:protein of unknown function [uncultured Woeseiaceae bacterium]|uniref:Terminase small subunit n=1 Tax=uncultured Woeseiaceae bacterium TaxID=1983305 RepID=A0A7D9H5H6_9GAMM|nr:protein of unknown function [uncultured Woeseiaceae bacterium]